MLAGNLEHQRVAQTVFHSFLNFSSRNFGPVKSHLHKNARFDVTILTKARIYAPLSPFLVLFGVRRKPLNFHLVFTTSGKVPAQSKPQVLTIKDFIMACQRTYASHIGLSSLMHSYPHALNIPPLKDLSATSIIMPTGIHPAADQMCLLSTLSWTWIVFSPANEAMCMPEACVISHSLLVASGIFAQLLVIKTKKNCDAQYSSPELW